LAERLGSDINSELSNIKAAIIAKNEGGDESQLLAQEKQKISDLMAEIGASGITIPVTMDEIEAVTSLEELQAKMISVSNAMSTIRTDSDASADALENLMASFGAGDEADAIRADADALAQLRGEAADAEADMNHAGEAMEALAIPTTTGLDAITSLTGGIMTLIGTGAALKGVFDTFQDADATPVEKITAALSGLMAITMAMTTLQ
jgi:hypothetical protein